MTTPQLTATPDEEWAAEADALPAADEEHVHIEKILVVDGHRDFCLRIDRCDGATMTRRGGERREY